MARGGFGAFGKTPASARATEFFAWFHLEEEGMPLAGARRFRPSGPAFHDCVVLTLETKRGWFTGEELARVRLELDRSFIEDARNGAFAADIAASFVENGVCLSDRGAVASLVHGLRRLMADRASVIVAAGAISAPPRDETEKALLDVYRGQRPRAELRAGKTVLLFVTGVRDGRERLSIEMERSR